MKSATARQTLLPAEFHEAFPFYFSFDEELRVLSLGRVLSRYCPQLPAESKLSDLVEAVHPIDLSLENLRSHIGQLFVLRFKFSNFLLRGQILERQAAQEFIFLGSPWLTSSQELATHSLTMADFALFDPIVDLLQVGQAKEMAGKDIEKLAERLRAKSVELENANEILKESNALLVAARDSAEAATRAKSDFLARMSHEIRTPMHGMLSMIDILSQKALDEESREYLQIMKDSSVSLLSIINDILDLSKIESGKMTLENAAFSVKALLQEILQLYAASALRKNIRLGVKCDFAADGYIGDANKVRQVLSNLVSNAIKFTDQGQIEIEAELMPEQSDKRTWLRFRVSDSGRGIPAEKQHLLFQNFSQIEGANNRKFGGTGLGLSISKLLSELMGGAIRYNAEYQKGAQFVVELPFLGGQPSPELAASGSPALPHKKLEPLVLVVDDHPTNRKIIELLFKKNRMNFVMAESAARALELVSTLHPKLVFMDVQMPEMDGLEATRKIRALADAEMAKVPVIAMTANALKGDRERFLECGMNDYISKPFTENDLLAMYEKWMGTAG